MYGPAVTGDDRRRSIYVQVQRSRPDEFLRTFDAPKPFSSRGRRNVTNVPAQSLAFLNGEFVTSLAHIWGESVANSGASLLPSEIAAGMFMTALGRLPTADEQREMSDYLRRAAQRLRQQETAFAAHATEVLLATGRAHLAETEREELGELLGRLQRVDSDAGSAPVDAVEIWQDLAQSIMNLKEFIFIP